jgi:hypothetical protein
MSADVASRTSAPPRWGAPAHTYLGGACEAGDPLLDEPVAVKPLCITRAPLQFLAATRYVQHADEEWSSVDYPGTRHNFVSVQLVWGT